MRYLVAFANPSLFEADVLAAEMIEETGGAVMICIIRQNPLRYIQEADGRSYKVSIGHAHLRRVLPRTMPLPTR